MYLERMAGLSASTSGHDKEMVQEKVLNPMAGNGDDGDDSDEAEESPRPTE